MADEKSDSAQNGLLIVVVGPSGAGKDTLLNWLKPRLEEKPQIVFVQRVVTRAVNIDDEEHIALSASEFAEMEHRGQFCAVWRAHGLSYGVPIDVCKHVRMGGVAILNGSRRALPDLRRVFPDLLLLHVTATIDVLADRLEKRGREDRAAIKERLEKVRFDVPSGCSFLEIDNSGPLELAGEAALKGIDAHLKEHFGRMDREPA